MPAETAPSATAQTTPDDGRQDGRQRQRPAPTRRSQANRDHLVNAAAALFWTGGYSATSLADIARQSGVPLGNVYYYFKTKAAIAEAVGELLQEQTREALRTVAVEHDSPPARLAGLFRLFAAANPARALNGCPIASASRTFAAEAPGAARTAGEAFALMRDWITANLVTAGMTEPGARQTAEDWLSRWQGAIALAHAMKDRALLDRATDRLIGEAKALDAKPDGQDARFD
jgi:AcrR family transcriptional regulator